MPGDGPRLADLASVYAAADEDALSASDLAALTPATARDGLWADAVFSSSVLAGALQIDSGPPSAETRPALRVSLSILAMSSAATAGSLISATQLRLAHAPPEQRAALQSGLVRDVDALRILLFETAEEAVVAAFASDEDFDAALVAFRSRGALLQDVVGRFQAATAGDP